MSGFEPIKIGIVGLGKMSVKRHIPTLLKLESEGFCKVVVLCDVNRKVLREVSKTYGIDEIETDASILCTRDDIDAVCIFGPPEVHYTIGLSALRANKHLFVEKPPAPSPEKLMEMIYEAKRHKKIAVVGFNRRFQRNIDIMKSIVNPELILTAEATFHKANAGVPARLGMNSWLSDSGVHALDVLCHLMGGRPTTVYSSYNGGKVYKENFSALIEWGSQHAVFSSNNSTGKRVEKYVVHGYGVMCTTEGRILNVEYEDGRNERYENPADAQGGIYEEFEAFFEGIRTNKSPTHVLESSVSTLHLLSLIESGHQGTIDWSKIESEGRGGSKVGQLSDTQLKHASIAHIKHPKILVLNPSMVGSQIGLLNQSYKICYEDQIDSMTQEDKKDIVAVLTGGPGAKPPTSNLFDKLPSVKVLGVVGASVKKWGGEEAVKRGVAVINTADVYAEAVAEFIVMQAILGLRKASLSHETMRRGGWGFTSLSRFSFISYQMHRVFRKLKLNSLPAYVPNGGVNTPKFHSRILQGKTVGLVGYGEVTKKVIPLFKAFGCSVLVKSDYLDGNHAKILGCKVATIAEVLRADVVSMQSGLSLRTERLLGVKEINSLRPGSVFINSGRAGLVDTDALVNRIKKGDIFACLDVFDQEPPRRSDSLRNLKNVFLTSHIAGSIKHIDGLVEKSLLSLIGKIVRFLNEDESEDVIVVTKEQLDNMT